MSYSRPLLLASVCAAALTWSAAPRAETLDKAVAAALAEHPSVQAATANRDALNEDVKEKKSEYWPTLSAEAQAGRIYADNATSRGLSVTRGAGYSNYGQGSLSLNEKFFDGFQTLHHIDAAEARRDSAAYSIDDVQDDLTLRTILAYLDVMRGRESVEQLKDYAATLKDYNGRIAKAVQDGGADATMREQARDIQAQLDNTLAGAQAQLQTAIASYIELTGRAPEGPMEKPVPPLASIPPTPEDAVSYARDHHPNLRAAVLTEQASAADTRAERGAYFPVLSGALSYMKEDQKDLIGGEAIDARAVVKLNWDYATGGAEQARVRKSVYQHAQTRAQRENLQRQITRRIAAAYSDAQSAKEQTDIQRERVSINEGLFTTQKQQFEGGKVNLLQLLQTDNSLFNARLSLMNNEYRLLAAQYSIIASIGQLRDTIRPQRTAAAPAASHREFPQAGDTPHGE